MPDKALILQIEEETGFACYENPMMSGAQFIFYGTSDKFDDFKTLATGNVRTGTVASVMDSGEMYIYSAYSETWYEM